MNPQAKIHIAQIIETQLKAGQNFEAVMKMLEWIAAGTILAACKIEHSELCGVNTIEMLDHFRENVKTILQQIDVPEDVVAVALENARRMKRDS